MATKPAASQLELVCMNERVDNHLMKRKWFIPKQHFVLVWLSEKQLKKLAKWDKKGDSIAAHVLTNTGELMLTNETLHVKWMKRKHRD